MITPQDTAANRADLIILDVRRDDELLAAHIGGDVVHIPLDQLPQRWQELPEGKIAVLCHHGVRAQKAAGFLEAQGREAVAIAGGIEAWSLAVDASVPRY